MYTIKDVIDVLKSTRNCNLKCNDCILNKSIVTNKIEKNIMLVARRNKKIS